MPATASKNFIYRLALPFLAPSPRGKMTFRQEGEELRKPERYRHLLEKHHVLGASLLLKDGKRYAQTYCSAAMQTPHKSGPSTLFRVASLTKMATAAVTLLMTAEGCFSLDDAVSDLLPGGEGSCLLKDITPRQLLSHTSGLRDIPAVDIALREKQSFHQVLREPGIKQEKCFAYCNFGFGLMGAILEQQSGLSIEKLYQQRLFGPLGMTGGMDGSRLDRARIMPIERVLRYHPGRVVQVTPLGSIPLTGPDPLHHFGHTAGSMYTDAASMAMLMDFIARDPRVEPMWKVHAEYGKADRTMSYGLGLLLLRDPAISDKLLLGHQGFAYGCVDGAFWEEGTGRQVIHLNGGASECRRGRLGLVNRDVLRYGLMEEMPLWT